MQKNNFSPYVPAIFAREGDRNPKRKTGFLFVHLMALKDKPPFQAGFFNSF